MANDAVLIGKQITSFRMFPVPESSESIILLFCMDTANGDSSLSVTSENIRHSTRSHKE
jgi:hypothetical protein